MPTKKWMKKFVGVFISALLLVNTTVPIFAHSQNYMSEKPENMQVCVSEKASDDKLMEIDLSGQKISSHLMGKDAVCSDETSCSKQLNKDQTVKLDNILTDVSVRYKMKEQKLKEDFILHSKEAQNSFVLKYNIGDLHAEQINTQDILLLDKNGRAKMLISAPYMTDAAGARNEAVSLRISSEKDGVLLVDLTTDSSWLQDDQRSYPIEVDPLYSLPKDTLRKGDNNKDVAVLKSMLLEAGFGAGISKHEVMDDIRNEIFGPITERFVRTFQMANGLDVTGVADIRTLDVLAKCLERKKILDTQEHIDQFLKRVAERSSPETGEQIKGVASFFRRVNFTDLAVTVGITGVATVVGAACFPLIGVAGVLAIGAAVGATANGVSEYAQQKEVGDSVDIGRVGIKALGGALKGGMSAIPGVSMYNAFGKAVNAAGQTLRPVLSTAVGDAIGKAAVTAATNALTPTVVCHAVGSAGRVLVSAAATDTLVASGGAFAVGAAEGIGCAVKSGKTVKEATQDAALNGAFQAAAVPVAAGVVVGGAACGAAYIGSKKPNPPPAIEVTNAVVIPIYSEKPKFQSPSENPLGESDPVVIPSPPESPPHNPQPVQDSIRHAEGEKSTKRTRQAVDQAEESTIPDAVATRIRMGIDAKASQPPQAAETTQKPEIDISKLFQNVRTATVKDVQQIRAHYPLYQALDMEQKRYEKDLKMVAEIRKSVEEGTRKLTKEEEHQLKVFESTARQAIEERNRAKMDDPEAKRIVENESCMTPKQVSEEQIRRYKEMIGRQILDRLANKFK